MIPSSAVHAPLRTLQKAAESWCPPSDWCSSLLCPNPSPSPQSLGPTAPTLLPGRQHISGPASAGSRADNWKGELQSTKAYQQAARESSAANTGGPAWGPEWAISLWLSGMGLTHTSALHHCGWSRRTLSVQPSFSAELPRLQIAASEWEPGMAQHSVLGACAHLVLSG